ncbi:hypothetical protein IT575_05065 [bacterium]|nr:hypothetical protein [bacterium]
MDFGIVLAWSAGVVSVLGVLLHPLLVAMRNKERQRDRELLLRLVQEKLDVLRSAIAAGYDEEQMLALDSRLERLIGSAQFTDLVREIGTHPDAQGNMVLDTPLKSQDLAAEGGGAAAKAQKGKTSA